MNFLSGPGRFVWRHFLPAPSKLLVSPTCQIYEAQTVLEPPIQVAPQIYEASSKEYTREPNTSICNQAPLEKQMTLVGDMGLTYGQETQKVRDLMIQLEQRDKAVTVERGIMKHHS